LKLADGFSDYKARQIYADTIQYFYIENTVSKNAWRNLYAEKMDKVANFAMLAMKDVSDAAKVHKMFYDTMIARDVNNADKEELPDNFFDKPINLLSLDSRIFEFGTANRDGLDDFIDGVPDLTEKEKIRIKQEMLSLPLKLFPDVQEDARKT
jgi:hypothetical protein